MSIKLIHTSDWQIGKVFRFLDNANMGLLQDARLRAITRLGELATAHGARHVLVAGDVYDMEALSPRSINQPIERMRAFPDLRWHLLPGNHDPLVADSVFYKTSAENVHVIADSEPIEVAPGVELVGAPYLSKRANHDLVRQALEPLEPAAGIRIAVGHGQVDSRSGEDDADTIDLAFVEDCLDRGVIDYLALGDTHSTASLGTTGRVWFSGSPETTDYKETSTGGGEADSGNALVVRVGDKVDVDKRRIGRWTFEALDAAVDSAEDVERFLARLGEYPDKVRTAVKYSLRGTLGVEAHARLQRGLDEYEAVFASLRPRERTMDLYLEPSEEELASLDISGYAAEALHELLDNREDPVARDAANLLFRLEGKS